MVTIQNELTDGVSVVNIVSESTSDAMKALFGKLRDAVLVRRIKYVNLDFKQGAMIDFAVISTSSKARNRWLRLLNKIIGQMISLDRIENRQ